jgi:hypothetical protein
MNWHPVSEEQQNQMARRTATFTAKAAASGWTVEFVERGRSIGGRILSAVRVTEGRREHVSLVLSKRGEYAGGNHTSEEGDVVLADDRLKTWTAALGAL